MYFYYFYTMGIIKEIPITNKVLPSALKDIRKISADTGESQLEVVARLAKEEKKKLKIK